ncbi:MAG: hypothetical protein R3284_00180 [Rubricoccaceae bacterium]|nr:hypothetical protein [Rubricoccaceae bacterium]
MTIEALVREYLPHAPKLGLYVAPDIPREKLDAARLDYAPDVGREKVLALFDATRFNSARDGVLFLHDQLVFQNNNLHRPRAIRYDDIVRVQQKRRLLGGRKVKLDINQGRATVSEVIDFSAEPDTASYVERFLREAMLLSPVVSGTEETDYVAVEQILDQLFADDKPSSEDRKAMLEVLRTKKKATP